MSVLSDFGPVYTETDLSRFPVEPWNTYSNICFLVLIVYWYFKLRGSFYRHPLMGVALPILSVGFIGGTVFHATRSHFIWLALDFMPIIILALLAALFFWKQVLRSSVAAVLVVLLVFLVSRLLLSGLQLPHALRISLGYSSMAILILVPATIVTIKAQFPDWHSLIGTIISFAIAITFRWADGTWVGMSLPMGTHFLWHIFGAYSVHRLISLMVGVGAGEEI